MTMRAGFEKNLEEKMFLCLLVVNPPNLVEKEQNQISYIFWFITLSFTPPNFFFSYRCVLLRVGRESLSTTRIKIKKLKRGHFSVNEKSQEYLLLISVAGNPNDWQ